MIVLNVRFSKDPPAMGIHALTALLLLAATQPLLGHPPGGFVVEPFLTNPTPTSMHIAWETTDGNNTRVEYGTTTSLGSWAAGTWITGSGADRIHHVDVTGLQPDTRYFYKAYSAPSESWISSFRTPPASSTGDIFTFTVYSDCQYGSNGVKHQEIINDGILDFYADEYGGAIEDSLAFSMLPGDLVSTGSNHSHWTDHFFGQAVNLYKHVPLIPAPGNHEANANLYFMYMDVPHNAPPGLDEHCHWFDHQNVRVISLDSNGYVSYSDQYTWLDDILADACADDEIDFVFAQFHHPHKSEAWTPGESSFSSTVVSKLEQFSTDCGKPSIHFFGHTHSYSRGQSRDHDHLMVNVATGMGSIDYWWDYPNQDYDEFQITLQEWGFVQLEVDTSDEPWFRLRRVSRGNDYVPLDNAITDEILIRKNNLAPAQPSTVSPGPGDSISGVNVQLNGSAYVEAQGDAGLESHWQVALEPDGFDSPVVDEWKRRENWYRPPNGDGWYSVNTVTDPDITRVVLEDSLPGCRTVYWRVRYRDEALGWSDWSEPSSFFVSDSDEGDTAPEPVNGATGVQLTSSLRWHPCDPADLYDIYFGTDSSIDPGDLLASQTTTEIPINGLALNTVYYWRVDSHYDGTIEEGPVWSFTTTPGYPSLDTAEWRFQDESFGDDVELEAFRGGSTLTPKGMTLDSDWTMGVTDGKNIPHIDGEEADFILLDNVYGSGRGLQMYYDAPANGGGATGDVYHFTWIFDIFIEESQNELQCLWQGNDSNANDGEFFLVCYDGGFFNDGYHGEDMWPKGEWFRVAHRVDYQNDTAAIFVNGEKVLGDDLLSAPDWLWARDSGYSIWPLSDDGGETDVERVFCANIALVDDLMPDGDIAALGGPDAEGIFVKKDPSVPGDLTGDGLVNGADLGIFLSLWNTTNADADFNGDGTVNGGDLGVLLASWTD
jgi:hypothetical protein